MKTREEVENLKAQWCEDPCWDLDETEGFEDYAIELKAYQNAVKDSINREYEAKINRFMTKNGLRDPYCVAEYLYELEQRIAKLEER